MRQSEIMMKDSDAPDGTPPAGASDPPPPIAGDVVITIITPVDAGVECNVLADEQRQQEGKGAADVGAVAVDLGTDGGVGGSGDWGKMCRICYLSPGRGDETPELIQLGCGCKNDLGTAHKRCAEAWFRIKGNRCCEICGDNAKNITCEEVGQFGTESHEVRTTSSSRNSSERVSCWRGQPFCNFLMACMVIAFILPWFFRVNMF